jgi:hypothetical protein
LVFVDRNVVEIVVLVIALTYFVAHTALTRADQSFFDYRLLKNRNYVTGVSFIFIVGLVLFATRVLLPGMLETSASPAWNNPAIASTYDLSSLRGAAALDGVITQQAAMIGYIDDFWMMCILTVAVIPLIFLIKPTPQASSVAERIVIEQ